MGGEGNALEMGHIPFDANNEGELGFSLDVVGALLLAQAGETDLLALCIAVFLDVGLGALEDDATLLLLSLLRDTCQLEYSRTQSEVVIDSHGRFRPER